MNEPSRVRPKRHACWFVAGALLSCPASLLWAQTSEVTQCIPAQADLFCQIRPDSSQLPLLTQADIDSQSPATQSAWAIGGSTSITLPAGSSWSPGTAAINRPAIWVFDSAQLNIAGDNSSEVAIAASIFLCDEATLVVNGTALRINQDFSFEHWIWASDQSTLQFTDANILTGSIGAPNSQLFQALRGNSRLEGTSAPSASINLANGPMLLHVADSAVAEISDSSGLIEATVTPDAQLTVTDTDYLTAGLTVCSGDSISLNELPKACDINSDCFSGNHPVTNFNSIDVPSLSVNNSRVIGWQLTTSPGSTLNANNIDPHANTVIELTGQMNEVIQLPADAAPIGLGDRIITRNSAPILGWSLLPSSQSQVSILPDSQLLNVTVAESSVVDINGSTLALGRVQVLGGELTLRDSLVDQDVLNSASLSAKNTGFTQTLMTSGSGLTLLADSLLTQPPVVLESGQLLEIELSAPGDDSYFSGQTTPIIGSLNAQDSNGTLDPFPQAQLELTPAATGIATPLTTLNGEVDNLLLYTLDTGPLSLGSYDISLRFPDADSVFSMRRIEIRAPLIFSDRFETGTP